MGQLPPGQGLFGTAAYMAPEQIRACLQRRQGLPRGPLQGPAIDCWALGLTAFELLTGETLFGVKEEAPEELSEQVEAAREYHEHQLAAEHVAWVFTLTLLAACPLPSCHYTNKFACFRLLKTDLQTCERSLALHVSFGEPAELKFFAVHPVAWWELASETRINFVIYIDQCVKHVVAVSNA